jgi:hypothetical protein
MAAICPLDLGEVSVLVNAELIVDAYPESPGAIFE